MNDSKSRITQHLETLCKEIGSRHVGSIGEAKAADYIASVFTEQGYDVVKEAFPVVGWNCESYGLRNVDTGEALDMRPCFFSNAGEIEGSLVWITSRQVDSLSEAEVKGRICMVNVTTETGKVFGRNAIAERLDALGAGAAIFVSEHFEAINTKIQRSPFLDHLVTASISGSTLEELCRFPDATYRLEVSAHKFPHQSHNIIARVSGEGPRAVVGAHYDTAPLIEGASDNGSGTAALLEMAQQLKDRVSGPIDFVAFSAEEYIPVDFPPGSDDYVKRHAQDIRWFLNFDSMGMYGGEDKLQVGFPEKLPVTLSSSLPLIPYSGDGDDKVFHAAGIATLWIWTSHPFKKIHTIDDSLDRLSMQAITELVTEAGKLIQQLQA
ncbi:M28 family peptidase [Kiritimatiellota bacterium B12222]|nr:M28 family peptidase [Kiritimatiellota bacterium B12222]